MIRKLMIPVLSILILVTASSATIRKTDFSGEWTLDKEKTVLSQSQLILVKISISQKGNDLMTTRTYENEYGEQYPFDEHLTLDGNDSEIVIYDMPRKTAARWSEDGKSIIIHSTIKYYGNSGEEEFSVEETLNLEEKGKWLSIDFTTSSSYSTNKGTYFFKKE